VGYELISSDTDIRVAFLPSRWYPNFSARTVRLECLCVSQRLNEVRTWTLEDVDRPITPCYVIRQPLFLHHISRIALAECLALLISRQRGAVKATLNHAGRLGRFGKTPEWIATWIMSGVLKKTISVSFLFSRHSRIASLPKIER
jgi:hypothetical protein